MVRVPGTVHPVVDCYLEDVLKLTDYVGRVGLTMEQMARATEDLRVSDHARGTGWNMAGLRCPCAAPHSTGAPGALAACRLNQSRALR